MISNFAYEVTAAEQKLFTGYKVLKQYVYFLSCRDKEKNIEMTLIE